MFDKLKRLFVIEEEGKGTSKPAPEETAPPVEPVRPVSKPQTVLPPSPVSASTPATGKTLAKFNNILLSAMNKSNIEGFDYLEFKQSLQNLAQMPMDEGTRFQSAYATAKTLGVTPQRLMETAQYYLDVLKQEEQKFDQALNNQRTKQIGQKEQKIKQLDQLIKDKTTRIEQLKKEIEAHAQQMESMKSEIDQSAQKVNTTSQNFHASYEHITGQIRQDMENMKKYLK